MYSLNMSLLAPGLVEKAKLFFLKLLVHIGVFGPQHVLVAHSWLVCVLLFRLALVPKIMA